MRKVNARKSQSFLLSCFSEDGDGHYAGIFTLSGELLQRFKLPARGHAISLSHSGRLAAVFSRRPGDYVYILDLQNYAVVTRITADEGRHFYGHGVFTSGDNYLLCSENAYESGDGVIGVYDIEKQGQRVHEMPSFGVGPHEIKLLNDQRILIVANGGIQTHPDLPRVKLNQETMQPNLAYIDISSGQEMHTHGLPNKWSQLSIRHIDVNPDGEVAVAMQYEGNPAKSPPLVARQRGEGELVLLDAPAKIQRKLKNYSGSVAYARDGQRFAVTSPRGGIVTYWSVGNGYLGYSSQVDVSGIASADGYFACSDGTGGVTQVQSNTLDSVLSFQTPYHWDNHLTAIHG